MLIGIYYHICNILEHIIEHPALLRVMNLCLEMCEFEDGEARLVSGFPKVDMYLMAHDVSEVELQSLKRLELGGES